MNKLTLILKTVLELFKFGKSTVKGIQISGDVSLAKRIRKAIANGDAQKVRKIVERFGLIIDGKDIYGVFKHKENPAVLISVDMMVNYIQMKKIIKRYQRKEG